MDRLTYCSFENNDKKEDITQKLFEFDEKCRELGDPERYYNKLIALYEITSLG